MRVAYPYLKDDKFLQYFNTIRLKEQYSNILLLDWNTQNVIERLQGYITEGSINIDGASSLRRTASLSFYCNYDTMSIKDAHKKLSLHTKIGIEIGFKNTTNQYTQYDIIWFPLGVYIITDNTFTNSADGVTASLKLQDKMCLLNGISGGTFNAAVTFDTIENSININGQVYKQKPTIYQIIQQCVHHFGGEQLQRIIIDVPQTIKSECIWANYGGTNVLQRTGIDDETYSLKSVPAGSDGEKIYQKYDSVGYTYVPFEWGSDQQLTAKAGDSITTVLDNIANTLGNYEYFYDIDGSFVFRQVKNYLNLSKSTYIIQSLDSELSFTDSEKNAYDFNDAELITSYSNTPQYNKIKNDFVVWGKKDKTAIRYHVAIDDKPIISEDDKYEVIMYPHFGDSSIEDTIGAYRVLDMTSINQPVDADVSTAIAQTYYTGRVYKALKSAQSWYKEQQDFDYLDQQYVLCYYDEQQEKYTLLRQIILSKIIENTISYMQASGGAYNLTVRENQKQSLSNLQAAMRRRVLQQAQPPRGYFLQYLYEQDGIFKGVASMDDLIDGKTYKLYTVTRTPTQYSDILDWDYKDALIKERQLYKKYLAQKQQSLSDYQLNHSEQQEGYSDHISALQIVIEQIQKQIIRLDQAIGTTTSINDEDISTEKQRIEKLIAQYQEYITAEKAVLQQHQSNISENYSQWSVINDNITTWLEWMNTQIEQLQKYLDQLQDGEEQVKYKDTWQFITFVYRGEDYIDLGVPIVVHPNDWRSKIYLQGVYAQSYARDYNSPYYIQLRQEWTKIYNIAKTKKINQQTQQQWYQGEYYHDIEPDSVTYFLDLISPDSEVGQLSISNIGRRTYSVQQQNISQIFPLTPDDFIILIQDSQSASTQCIEDQKWKYNKAINEGEDIAYISQEDNENLLWNTSYYSAVEYMRDLLYEYTSYNESITLQTIPIYYLDANTKISANNPQSGIYGQYVIQSISIPLNIDGTSTIAANRALKKI